MREVGIAYRDVIRHEDEYFVRASSSLADTRTLVVKHDDAFAVFDRYGDVQPVGRGEQGFYFDGTRCLSRLELRLAGERPLLLSSTVTEDNALVAVDLANPRLLDADDREVEQDAIHVFRTALVWEGACHQRLRVHSFAAAPLGLDLSLDFAVDFADLFEVRGLERAHRGRLLEPGIENDRIVFGYEGLDDVLRRVWLRFEPAPIALDAERARFRLTLEPGSEQSLYLTVTPAREGTPMRVAGYDHAVSASRSALAERARLGLVHTQNEQFNDWVERSSADLRMMISRCDGGTYPHAGVPWFSTVFGRDGIITALETLWLDPSIAAGVLRVLAAAQADALDPQRDAEPGKILHEARGGELAAIGEVPFGRYYGSVDATPLFVMLAGAYYERTDDRALLGELWPHVLRALDWMDHHGDRDGDGFLEYGSRAKGGLRNQGWKDSFDSIFHEDGTLAQGPIAVCEVQAYAFAAKQAAATLADALDEGDRAATLRREADALRARFHRSFWLEDLGTFALALDGEKRPCRVRTSNAGHCLYAGIATPEQARAVAASLLADDSFSHWGVRTLASSGPRYNPMSYHNGSVWPHDNALIAAGLARYGLQEEALRILGGLFDASLFFELHRMPELFCGFPRRIGMGPTSYPVACAPQAWASGAVFLLLEACLGLRVSARERRVFFANPQLPRFLGRVTLSGLRVGDAEVDLELRRHARDVGLQIMRREGDVEVVVVK